MAAGGLQHDAGFHRFAFEKNRAGRAHNELQKNNMDRGKNGSEFPT